MQICNLLSRVFLESGFNFIGVRPLAMAPGNTTQGEGGDVGLQIVLVQYNKLDIYLVEYQKY